MCCHLLSLRCHLLSLAITRCYSFYHSLSFVITYSHLLTLVLALFIVTRCHSTYHSSVFLLTIVDETGEEQQSNEYIPRNNCFKTPRKTCWAIQFLSIFFALQLKQKSTAGVFHGILQNFRTATFCNNLGAASEKNREVEKDAQWPLWF